MTTSLFHNLTKTAALLAAFLIIIAATSSTANAQSTTEIKVTVKAPDGAKITVKIEVADPGHGKTPEVPFNLYTVKAVKWGVAKCGSQKFTDSEGRLWILVSGPAIERRQYVTGLYERGTESGLPYLRVGGSLFKDPPSE